ncbi:hypothetical protein L9F63_018412, partial [Diploptera punctata]
CLQGYSIVIGRYKITYPTVRDGEINTEFQEKLQSSINKLLLKFETNLQTYISTDYSVYTGTSGIALLFILLEKRLKRNSYSKRAMEMVESYLPKLKRQRVSYLNGDAGPLAIAGMLYYRQGNVVKAQEMIQRLKEMLPQVVNLNSDVPDEVLYGRTGYLYSLLFVNKFMGRNTIEADIIKKVVSTVLRSGQNLAQQEGRNVPLMYMWHEKYYLGGAHGIAGILFMLLQAKDYMSQDDLNNLVRPTIDFLQGITFPSDNFPSSLGSSTDKLVQWCHGAPGVVFLFAEAYKVFGDKKYLETALKCGEVVWKRGVLKKGYSICHGVAGNAYTFLVLYQLTGDVKHLYRSCRFAEWCYPYGKHQYQVPDRPLSLFEGFAGVIYFLVDLQEPKEARFPAFAL